MTEHPCAGRSPGVIEVFEMIAINQTPPYRPAAIRSLLKAGLIEPCGEAVLVRDRFGTVKVPVYGVPLPIHYQWCRWCSEQPEIEI
jgi:hypothetical protein